MAITTQAPRLFQGKVGQGQLDAAGEFTVPPTVLVPEPATVVQFTSLDGSLTVRAQVETDGTWKAWLPQFDASGYIWWTAQATHGGRSVFLYDPYQGLRSLAPPGAIVYNSNFHHHPEPRASCPETVPPATSPPSPGSCPSGRPRSLRSSWMADPPPIPTRIWSPMFGPGTSMGRRIGMRSSRPRAPAAGHDHGHLDGVRRNRLARQVRLGVRRKKNNPHHDPRVTSRKTIEPGRFDARPGRR